MINNRKKNSNIVSALDEIKSFIVVIILAIAIRIFVIELFFVPTGSMKANILENDYVFSTKYSYGYSRYSMSIPFLPDVFPRLFDGRIMGSSPERGDIIIFKPTDMIRESRYIKRLIGMPGDKVQIIEDVVYLNDVAVTRAEKAGYTDEQGIKYKVYEETLPNGKKYNTYYSQNSSLDSKAFLISDYKLDKNTDLGYIEDARSTEAFYVPEDNYFFLGDNRYNSADSRFALGYVPFENLIARARFILFSTSQRLFLEHLNIVSVISRIPLWLSSIRFNRMFLGL